MKMIFFSSDPLELAGLGQELAKAGIPCEVCRSVLVKRSPQELREGELWLRNDGDRYRALLLCVEQHVGFARKARNTPTIDEVLAAMTAA